MGAAAPRGAVVLAGDTLAGVNPGAIREVRLKLPVAPPAVLSRVTPAVVSQLGPSRVEIALRREPLELASELVIG